MSVIWSKGSLFQNVAYGSESQLEAAILEVQSELFGPDRIYLDVKKKIGAKDGLRNIPDGYLVDLSERKPRLFVVENELASHDPLRHIAVQILQFSLSFEEERRAVKTVLLNAIQSLPVAKAQCESYVLNRGLRNLDHMLEQMVYESPFAALVIIDELPEKLETVLAEKFQFGVEVLKLARYENSQGEHLYHFEPFLADLQEDVASTNDAPRSQSTRVDLSEIDTVVVPAREDGFQEVFIRENRWYKIRIHGTMRPQIKYIAAYRVAPDSAITHIAPVKSIEPWGDTGKYVVNFAEAARQIGPVQLVRNGRVKAPQNLRYTTQARLEAAKTLDEVW